MRDKKGFKQWGSHTVQRIGNNPLWPSILFIFLLSAGLRTSLVLLRHQYLDPQVPETGRIAISIAETGMFGNPWVVSTGPTAHNAPFLPFILSFVFRFFGPGPPADLAVKLISIIACSLQYAFLPLLASYLGWELKIGVGAGLAGALLPFRFWLETEGYHEQVYVGVALLLVVLITAAAWRSRRLGISSAAWRGIVWALTFHVSPSLLPVCLALMAIEVAVIQGGRSLTHMPYLAALTATMLLSLAPWTARNYYHFRKLFFIRDNFGMELAISNHNNVKVLLDDNLRAPSYRHPAGSTAEALKLRQMGEIAYNDEKMWEALAWIRSHPGTFLKLTLLRIVYFWFPPMQRDWQRLAYVLLTLLGLAGAWSAFRRKQIAAWLMTAVWITFPAIYYLVESAPRYRYPLDWTLLLMASYGLTSWLQLGSAGSTKRGAGLASRLRGQFTDRTFSSIERTRAGEDIASPGAHTGSQIQRQRKSSHFG